MAKLAQSPDGFPTISGDITLNVKSYINNNNPKAFYQQCLRFLESKSLNSKSFDFVTKFVKLYSSDKTTAVDYIGKIGSIIFSAPKYIATKGNIAFFKQCRVLLHCKCLNLRDRKAILAYTSSVNIPQLKKYIELHNSQKILNYLQENNNTIAESNSGFFNKQYYFYHTAKGIADEVGLSEKYVSAILNDSCEYIRIPAFKSSDNRQYYTLRDNPRNFQELIEEIQYGIRVLF